MKEHGLSCKEVVWLDVVQKAKACLQIWQVCWFHLFKDCMVLLEFLFIFPLVGRVTDFLYLF